MWKMFHYFPKKKRIAMESVQFIYGKKSLKMLKVAVTQWLTHDSASKQILDCFCELMETIDQICLNTAESEARGYRALLTNHKALFCVCFLTDILSIMKTLSLVLQKTGVPLVDSQHYLTLDKFCKLAKVKNTSIFWTQQKAIMLLTKNTLTL